MKYLFFSIGFLSLLISCSNDLDDLLIEETFAVNTIGSELPYVKISVNQTIQNEPKVSAKLSWFENRIKTLETPIGIEYRGSTSFRLTDKKSYGIEVWDSSGMDAVVEFSNYPIGDDFMFTGQVLNVNDQWIWDATLLHHYLGYYWYNKMGHYASRSTFVDLEINNDYKGVYVFMEKLKRDKNRINIAKLTPDLNDQTSITGGYILKIDKTAGGDVAPNQPLDYYLNNWGDDAIYTQDNSFRSSYDSFGNSLSSDPYGYKTPQETYFLYEYPKAEVISEAQKNYIQEYIANFELALLSDDFSSSTRTYTDYIDLQSFADYMLINEVTKNIDGYRLSTYLHKDRGGKLKMGPIWDLNIGYNIGGRIPDNEWVINYNDYVPEDLWLIHFWWKRLLQDPQFMEIVKQRWALFRSTFLSDTEAISFVEQTSNYLINNDAIERNYERWPVTNFDYNQRITDLKQFLINRMSWMDNQLGL